MRDQPKFSNGLKFTFAAHEKKVKTGRKNLFGKLTILVKSIKKNSLTLPPQVIFLLSTFPEVF